MLRVLLKSKPEPSKSKTERRKSKAERLLFSRFDTAHALGTSVASVMRIEKEGRLKPIRLNPRSPTAKTYYKASEVYRLAQGDGDAAG